jgi:hypothetical protein
MGADDVEDKSAQRNDDEYRDQNGHRNPHEDAHVKSPSRRRRSFSWLPSLRPTTNIREVDLVQSLRLSLFPYSGVNNQSLVDAAFRDRKRDVSLNPRRAARTGVSDRPRPQAVSASCQGRGIWENATK